ncbi:MAG: glycosyltransferase family 39 protein [Deltaproteobacteria bacterium]|nr:glycosyltransferase family 39 protein [Deltaproteobacteria bacterium]
MIGNDLTSMRTDSLSRSSSPLLGVPLLILITVVAFLPSLGGGLSNDDFIWIHGAWRATRQSWWAVALVPHPWWSQHFLRPLVQLTFFLDFAAAGLRPWAFHLTNILLHLINVWLVWRLALLRFSRQAAFLAALLFSFHPTHAWSVGWVAGRTQLLCATFFLLALHAHLGRRSLLAGAAFAAALLSNEAAIVFPLVAWAASRWLVEQPLQRRIFPTYAALLATYLALRATTTGLAYGMIGVDPTALRDSGSVANLWRSKITLLGEYLLAPLPIYGFRRSLIALSLLTLIVLRFARRRGIAAFAAAWLALSLVPYLGWYQLQPWYIYLPSAAGALFLVSAAFDPAARPGPAPSATWRTLLLAMWILASFVQLCRCGAVQDRSGRAHMDLLAALRRELPTPAQGSRLCFSGLEMLRLGADPTTRAPIFVFGLNEAVQLAYGDPSLAAAFADPLGQCTDDRPGAKILLAWKASTQTFVIK